LINTDPKTPAGASRLFEMATLAVSVRTVEARGAVYLYDPVLVSRLARAREFRRTGASSSGL
jgi:hypothetical protein